VRALLWALVLTLVGCSDASLRRLESDVDPTFDDPVFAEDPEAGDDDDDDDDTGPQAACPVPVPDHVDLSAVVWAEPDVHFYVPEPSWAFAVAHASRQVENVAAEGIDLVLRPSYFLATAVKESFMGCSDSVGPDPVHVDKSWARQPAADWDGCFQLESTTAWIELCRLYPGDVDCTASSHQDAISSMDQGTSGRDNVESGAFAVAWYGTFAYAMLTTHGLPDPDAWFAGAADPQALLKTIALIYNRGAWSGEIDSVLQGCQGSAIEDCVSAGSIAQDYVQAVASYAADMEAALATGSCYDQSVTAADVSAYVSGLSPIFAGEDWGAIEAAALAAFAAEADGEGSLPFQQVAGPVMDAMDGAMNAKLACPDAQLGLWYGAACPP